MTTPTPSPNFPPGTHLPNCEIFHDNSFMNYGYICDFRIHMVIAITILTQKYVLTQIVTEKLTFRGKGIHSSLYGLHANKSIALNLH